MVVEGNTHELINGHVDQTQTIFLALGHCDTVVITTARSVLVGAIDQKIVGRRGSTSGLQTDERLRRTSEGCPIVPVKLVRISFGDAVVVLTNPSKRMVPGQCHNLMMPDR